MNLVRKSFYLGRSFGHIVYVFLSHHENLIHRVAYSASTTTKPVGRLGGPEWVDLRDRWQIGPYRQGTWRTESRGTPWRDLHWRWLWASRIPQNAQTSQRAMSPTDDTQGELQSLLELRDLQRAMRPTRTYETHRNLLHTGSHKTRAELRDLREFTKSTGATRLSANYDTYGVTKLHIPRWATRLTIIYEDNFMIQST